MQIYNYAATFTASKLAAVSARTAIGASFSKLEGLFALFLTAEKPAATASLPPYGQPASAAVLWLSFPLVAILAAGWSCRRGARLRRKRAHVARPASNWRRHAEGVLV